MYAKGLIIGGGILGSAVAAELSSRGMSGLHVVDADLEGTLSATERHAGIIQGLALQPVNELLGARSFSLFERLQEQIEFRQAGSLWLFTSQNQSEGESLLRQAQSLGQSYQAWTPKEVRRHYPFLDKLDGVTLGVFGPRDGVLQPRKLRDYFRHQAKSQGVIFHDKAWVSRIEEAGKGVWAETLDFGTTEEAVLALQQPSLVKNSSEKKYLWECDFAVLCAGGWSGHLLGACGRASESRPVKRHLSLVRCDTLDTASSGTVRLPNGFFLRPHGQDLITGQVGNPGTEGYFFDYPLNQFDSAIWPALFERSTSFSNLRLVTGWGTVFGATPDLTGILGRVPGLPHVFEAHSFAGRELGLCQGIAETMADLITETKTDPRLSLLSSQRFTDGQSLAEIRLF